ncbi:hypothetical protein NPIL_612001 [Nephila pilipes]|uniref:Uncharacterized protein n=1 Tax=Nephila pilipes TaxID=299642 RepID=A0A8X6U3H3_NEPPI|nr:hypothetical protein NPIL_612001 [Nephila pilipes]
MEEILSKNKPAEIKIVMKKAGIASSEFNSKSRSASDNSTELESGPEEYPGYFESRSRATVVLGSTSEVDSTTELRSAPGSRSDSGRASTMQRSPHKSNRKFTRKSI